MQSGISVATMYTHTFGYRAVIDERGRMRRGEERRNAYRLYTRAIADKNPTWTDTRARVRDFSHSENASTRDTRASFPRVDFTADVTRPRAQANEPLPALFAN